MPQNLQQYAEALLNRTRKLGHRVVFINLPAVTHKQIKSGDKFGFCDFPQESQATILLETSYQSHYVGCYSPDISVEELVEDLQFAQKEFGVLGCY